MAIAFFRTSNVSRASGNNINKTASSCAALAYQSGEKVRDERLKKTFSYSRQERVVSTGTMLPKNAPAEFSDPHKLFNSIEKFETAADARTAKRIVLAFPVEMTKEQRVEALEYFIEKHLNEKGYAAAYAIHKDKDSAASEEPAGSDSEDKEKKEEKEINPHGHILIPNRPMDKDGNWVKAKSKKEYELDKRGKKIPIFDKEKLEKWEKENGRKFDYTIEEDEELKKVQKIGERGRRNWKRIDVTKNELDKKEFMNYLKSEWAKTCNKYLAQDNHIDFRSYEERGINQLPQVHEGYGKGKEKRHLINLEIKKINEQLKEYDMQLAKLDEELRKIEEQERLVASQIAGSQQDIDIPKINKVLTNQQNVDKPKLKKENSISHNELKAPEPSQKQHNPIYDTEEYKRLYKHLQEHTANIETLTSRIKASEERLIVLDKKEKYIRSEMKKFKEQGGVLGFIKKQVFDLEPAKAELRKIKQEKEKTEIRLKVDKDTLASEIQNKKNTESFIKDLLEGKGIYRPRTYTDIPIRSPKKTRTKTEEQTEEQTKSSGFKR